MKKIRIGNDIHFKWMVTRGGAVESFDGKEVDVELRDQTGRRWPCKWSINADDGCVDGVFYGHMQQAPGIYSLTLTENRGGKGMATVDRTAAWQLVARQDNACEGGDEGALGVSVELMASEIAISGGVAAEPQEPVKKAKRVKRYVIGRAIRPGSLEDTGHENRYCYKDNFDSLVNIPVYVGYRKGSVEHLYVDGEKIDFIRESMGEMPDSFADLLTIVLPAYQDQVVAFTVRKYEWAADSDGNPQRKLSLWLESKLAPPTVASESTHHSFVGGKRVWRGNFLRDNGIEIGGEMFRFGGHTRIELARKMRLELGRKFIAWKKTKGVLRRNGKKLTDGDGKPVKKSWYKCLSRTGGGTLKMPGLFRIRERQEYFGRLGADVRVRLFIRLSMTEIAGGGGMAGGMERELTPARKDRAYLHVVKE